MRVCQLRSADRLAVGPGDLKEAGEVVDKGEEGDAHDGQLGAAVGDDLRRPGMGWTQLGWITFYSVHVNIDLL